MEHSPFRATVDGASGGKGTLMCWMEGATNLHFLRALSPDERLEHVCAHSIALR